MRTILIYGTDIHGPEDFWSAPWVERPSDPDWSMTSQRSMDALMYDAAAVAQIDALAILLRGDHDGGYRTPQLKRSIANYPGTVPNLLPFIDTGALSSITGWDGVEVAFDFANPQHCEWFWERFLQPFYREYPEGGKVRYERTKNNRLLVAFWGINPSGKGIINQSQSQKLLDLVNQRMQQAGLGAVDFIVDQSFLKYAPQLKVFGVHDWFIAATHSSYSIHPHNGVTTGVAVPGFHVANQPTWVIPRNNGNTLRNGLAAMRGANADYVILEGYTNVAESAGYYRSNAWSPDTLYLDIIREHIQMGRPTVPVPPPPVSSPGPLPPTGGPMIGLKDNGKFVGCAPGTNVIYADRDWLKEWEDVRLTQVGPEGWFNADLVATGWALCLDQLTGKLVARANHDGWGGQWALVQDDAGRVWLKCANKQLEVIGLRMPKKMSRIHAYGYDFRNEQDQTYIWAHTSGFKDLDRLMRGQDIRPVLAQSKDQDANGRRVFGMKSNWAIKVNGVWQAGPDRTIPQEHPDYYQKVEQLADIYSEFDHYLNLVVFVDTRDVMGNINDQLAHWGRIVEIARRKPNMILSLVNEQNAHSNAVDIARFPQPDGVLASTGSNGGGSNPPTPMWGGKWGYSELHPERRDDRPSLGTTTLHFAINGYSEGADSYAGTKMVTVASEPLGFDEVPEGGRRTNDPKIAWLLGLGCAWGTGGTGLSTDGIESVLLRPVQDACMRAFIAGVKAGLTR